MSTPDAPPNIRKMLADQLRSLVHNKHTGLAGEFEAFSDELLLLAHYAESVPDDQVDQFHALAGLAQVLLHMSDRAHAAADRAAVELSELKPEAESGTQRKGGAV